MERIGGHLEPMKITKENFSQILINQFATHPGNYSFTSFVTIITEIIVTNRIGFDPSDKYTYINATIGFADQAILREIIWDMIVERHLTIGGSGHHDWPSFSVTERGKI